MKTADILPDLPFLLKEGIFLDTKAKYVGGLRFLLECESSDAMSKLLEEGRETLSSWFRMDQIVA